MKLDQRVAVVTGAGSGIGRALAHSLAARGCHLALVDLDAGGLEQTAAALRGPRLRVSTHAMDVSDRAAVRALPQAVRQVHGEVHLVVNNAGVALGGLFEQVREEDFDWLMSINFQAVVQMTRAFLPHLREAGTPTRIVNVSSLFGLVAPPGQTAYCASKFAVRGFSNALRHELAGSSVGVSVVHPGGVATAIANRARVPPGADAAQVERERRHMQRMLRLPPERAGEIIAAGIERDQARILVGTDAKLVSIIERLMPVSYWSVIQRLTGQRPVRT